MLRGVFICVIVFAFAQSAFGQQFDRDALRRSEPKKGAVFDKLKALAKGQTAEYWQGRLNDKQLSQATRVQAAQVLYFHGAEKNTVTVLLRRLFDDDGLVALHSLQTVVYLCPKDEKCLKQLVALVQFDIKRGGYFTDFCMSRIFAGIVKYGKQARPYVQSFLPLIKRDSVYFDFETFVDRVGLEPETIEPLFEAILTTKRKLVFEKAIAANGQKCLPALRKYLFSKDWRQEGLAWRAIYALAKSDPELCVQLFPTLKRYNKEKKGLSGMIFVRLGERVRSKIVLMIDGDEIEQFTALAFYAKHGYRSEPEKVFIETQLKSKKEDWKLRALKALIRGEKDKSALVKRLLKYLDGDDLFLKVEVLNALIRLKTEPKLCIPKLKALLSHDETLIRSGAASALGQFGAASKDCLPALKALLDDDDFNVADDAEAAIEKIEKALKKQAEKKSKKQVKRRF